MHTNKQAKIGIQSVIRLFLCGCFSSTLLAAPTVIDKEYGNSSSISIASCVKLKTIDLEEEKSIKKRWWHQFENTYIGRCLNSTLIKEILSSLSEQYIKHGYITTRPYLKQQDASDGHLDIHVATGYIESIVDSKTKISNSRIESAFLWQQGDALNLRDLEDALEIMKRVSSKAVTMAIKPGFFQGASIIEIDDHGDSELLPYRLKMGFIGRKGSQNTRNSINADLSVANPLEINDILRLSRNNSQGNKGFQSNDSWDLNYSFPAVRYLLEFSVAKFDYKQGVVGLGDAFSATGETKVFAGKVNKVFFRNQTNKLSTSISLKQSDSKNYFADQLLDVSSYKTTQIQMDLTHEFLQQWGELTTTYSLHQGTDWFNARTDSYFAGGSEQATLQFTKHVLSSSLIYFPASRRFHWTSDFYWQYTDNLLFNNDKLTVGSDYTVRGYLDRNIFGNNAWYIKNDAVKSWSLSGYPSLLHTFSLSVGLDAGHVRCEIDNSSSCGWIYGSALGIKTQGNKLTTKLVWGHPWKKLTNNFKRIEQFRLDLIWSF